MQGRLGLITILIKTKYHILIFKCKLWNMNHLVCNHDYKVLNKRKSMSEQFYIDPPPTKKLKKYPFIPYSRGTKYKALLFLIHYQI